MSVAVLGAGAFGISLAIALSRDGSPVSLWGRDRAAVNKMQKTRQSGERLPGQPLPESLLVTDDLSSITGKTCLLAIPTQNLGAFLQILPDNAAALVACCKGMDRKTRTAPVELIETKRPECTAAILTGPSFAVDIAQGLPTALVLAARNDDLGSRVQKLLNRPALRVYRTTDVIGTELGGALKNVVALAAGMAIGAGLGDSARASVIARGFSEVSRYAQTRGAQAETLQGLSGLGDLVLTCMSEKSRNFSAGVAMATGKPVGDITVEGLQTAQVIAEEAAEMEVELPLMSAVADIVSGKLDISDAIASLLARPVGKE